MVYSRSRTGTGSLIKTAVLCALSLSVIPSAYASGSLDASSSADVCGISDGDKSVGIRAIDDSSCASGGLGCYNDHCRFCKLLNTPQSSSFENCTEFGVEFPTMLPLITSTGTCEVSSGDAAVGISAITDETCLYGGLGCFNDHCRFCKETSTAQSDAFVDCTDSNSTDGSTTDSPVDTAASASSTTVDDDGCTLVPGAGDIEVGISIGTDPTCSAGGLGCINDVCRFCRIRTTTKSAQYTDCAMVGTSSSAAGSSTGRVTPAATTETPTATTAATETPAPDATTEAPAATTDTPAATDGATSETPASTTAAPAAGTTCSITASVGDATVGINIITDATCKDGGVGCIDSVCRFCKVTTSTQSAAFMDCSLFAGDAPTSEGPTADNSDDSDFSTDDSGFSDASDAAADTPAETPSATTAVPDVTTEAPSATTETPAATTVVPDATTEAPTGKTCGQTVSEGDASVGINIVTDASCSAGGTGCIDDICRFCKVATSTQSAAFVDCASIASTTDAPTEMPTEAPTETEAPTDTPTEAPTETEAPSATTETPAATTAVPVATTEAPTGKTCGQMVSEGDASVGINIVTDASCSAGGTGCIDDICRFCKVTTTTQSATFVDCGSITTTTESPTETPTETEAPTDTEAPTETPTEAPTETEAPTDTPTEAPTETEAPSATTETPAATTAVPDATTEAPTGATCAQTVSEGDASVGINIVTDNSCSAGGVGCIDSVCRFCKTTDTPQSSSFVDCSTIPGIASGDAETEDFAAFTAKETRGEVPEAKEVPLFSQYQAGAFVGGCVVAVAAVALVARAAKMANKSNANPNEPCDDDNVEDAENGRHVSPGPVPMGDDEEETVISTEA